MLYRERLSVPLSWWLIGLFFGLTFIVAVGVYLPPLWALACAVVIVALISAVLIGYSRTQIIITTDALQVGRATIDWRHVGEATPLDRAATLQRRGPGADARALLVLRPYLPEAVEIGIDDPADPHPYWLVSSRDPHAVAAAIRSAHTE